ncbi:MAG TPA: thiamine pyrophosphate-dependent dehydrogenase E1 component subunit alpha [Acidimicrobiales bacterium]|nr:thiamine pyrophosphate-dependent dehydrogenase E1 component subunit alpha [Acidimicrobiales bacterium]
MPTSDVEAGSAERALDWLRTMLLIRRFEERAEQLTVRGKISGGVHPAVGQEATAVGVASALLPGDTVSASHRGHHHALAKGITPEGLMAELFGKSTGVSHGFGGSMHLAGFDVGFIGSNGIVGAPVGISLGDAFAARYRQQSRISVALFGDGGLNTGRTWECLNLAAAWRLPLVAVCENNLYAVETATLSLTGGGSPVRRAEGFGLQAESVDGQDVFEVFAAVARAREIAVGGGGPSFIESRTYRYSGHGSGEGVGTYRSAEEIADWRAARDPIERLAGRLASSGVLRDGELEALDREAQSRVDDAVRFAEESPWP